MKYQQFMALVSARGSSGTYNQLKYARQQGYVDQTPRNELGEAEYTPAQVEQFCRYLDAQRTRRATQRLLQESRA